MNLSEHHFREAKSAVPNGAYYATDTSEQYAAMKWTKIIGKYVEINFPESAQMYENGMSYDQIAQELIPEELKKHPQIANKAIGYAVRALQDPEKQAKITKQHRRDSLNNRLGDRFSEKNREIWRKAQKIRTEIHGAAWEAMVTARGQTIWSNEEKLLLKELSDNPNYQTKHGAADRSKIKTTLNDTFHNGEEVRTTKSLGNYITNQRRVERNKK